MIQDSSRTKSRQAANAIKPLLNESETRFCEFVVRIAVARFDTEHPELSDTECRAQLKQAPGQTCDQMLLTLYDRGGTRLSEYEVQGTRELLFLRKVYRSPCDDPELAATLQLAEAKWPSSNDVHTCPKCWRIRIAIAIRVVCEDGWLKAATIFTGKACGSPTEAITDVDEKVKFLRSIGVDAFPVWIDESAAHMPQAATG